MFSKQLKFQDAGKNVGFSIIELMVVLGVLGILITVSAPSFYNLIANNRLLSEVYGLRATLSNARTEALAQRTFVTVCGSSNGASCSTTTPPTWNEGYIAFTDFNGDGVLDTGGARPDTIVQAKVLDNLTLGITLNPATAIRFNSRGNALGFSSTIKLCDDRDDDSKGRGMAVSNLGSVQALIDSDDPKDGIVNDHLNGGGNVACP